MRFQRDNILGTVVAVNFGLNVENQAALAEQLFAELKRIEDKYSRFKEGNVWSFLNDNRGQWLDVDEETWELLGWGKFLENVSGGVFNLAVEEILTAWGYDKNYSFQENKIFGEIISPELDLVNKKVKINSRIEFGGIGKGYALDCGVEILRDVPNFLIDFGGDLFARGVDESGIKWRVVYENPVNLEEGIGIVEVDGFYLASSNGIKRSWSDKHHLVDVKKGEPADEMLAVYVQASSGVLADGFATTLFCLGFERAKAFVLKNALSAMLVSKEGKVFRSSDFVGEIFIKG